MDELEPRNFSFNSPHGACPACAGLGSRLEIDPDRLVPDKSKSLRQGALRAVGHAADGGVLALEDHRGDLQGPRLGLRQAGPRPPGRGDGVPPARAQGRAGRHRLSPRTRREHVHRDVRGPHQQPRAALPRDRIGVRQDRAREVHGLAAVPDLRRQEAPAGSAGGEDRQAQHQRRRRAVGHRGPRLGDRPAEAHQRPGADDRPPAPQGDRRPARLPRRRRAGLPDDRPDERHPVRRRGPADPPGDPDRDDAHGRPVHPGRAHDRAPPARQRQAHRDAHPAARPRQHGPRRRARRGDDPDRRLGPRHRAGGRGARRRGHRQRAAGGRPGRAALDHRRLPARRTGRADPRRAPAGQRQGAPRARRPGAQPARASTRRSRSAASSR